jgi:hypothetical protein
MLGRWGGGQGGARKIALGGQYGDLDLGEHSRAR